MSHFFAPFKFFADVNKSQGRCHRHRQRYDHDHAMHSQTEHLEFARRRPFRQTHTHTHTCTRTFVYVLRNDFVVRMAARTAKRSEQHDTSRQRRETPSGRHRRVLLLLFSDRNVCNLLQYISHYTNYEYNNLILYHLVHCLAPFCFVKTHPSARYINNVLAH